MMTAASMVIGKTLCAAEETQKRLEKAKKRSEILSFVNRGRPKTSAPVWPKTTRRPMINISLFRPKLSVIIRREKLVKKGEELGI